MISQSIPPRLKIQNQPRAQISDLGSDDRADAGKGYLFRHPPACESAQDRDRCPGSGRRLGKRNGANSTEMKASDDRTHRRAIGRSRSFVRTCYIWIESIVLAHPPPLVGAGIARPMDGRSSERPMGGGSRGPRRFAPSLACLVGRRDPPPLSSPQGGGGAGGPPFRQLKS